MSVNTNFSLKKLLFSRVQTFLLLSVTTTLIVTFLYSCQKNRADSIAYTADQIETHVNKWLDNKKTVQPGERNERVEQLRDQLDFASAYSEDAGQGKTYLIVPVKSGFVSVFNKGRNPKNYLLLTQGSNGKAIKGNIVQFVSSAEKIPANTFRAMDELKNVEVDASFTFLTIFDRYLFTESHKNGRLSSFTEVSNKNKVSATASPSIESVSTNGMVCTDWWLITTEYYTDGSTNVYSEYFGQTCVNDGGCLPNEWCTPQPEEGGGGGEGGNTTYLTDIEYDKKATWTWRVYTDTIIGTIINSIEKVKGKVSDNEPDGFFTAITHQESYIASVVVTNLLYTETRAAVSFSGANANAEVEGKLYVQFQSPRVFGNGSTTTYSAQFP